MRKIFPLPLVAVLVQSVASCTPSKPPATGSNAIDRPIRFAMAPLGPRGVDTMTFKLSLFNASQREVYISFRTEFDWLGSYVVTHTTRFGEADSTWVPARPSLQSIEGTVCPELDSTFAIAKGEALSRVIKLEIPEGHRSFRKLKVLVNLDVPVFDATLSCREKPWVSGTAETVIE
jgi:hypothetical protein